MGLKVLPRSHSSATWCIMANAFMWCLPTTVHKEWCVGYYCSNDKESQHNVDTNISLRYLSCFLNKSMNGVVV